MISPVARTGCPESANRSPKWQSGRKTTRDFRRPINFPSNSLRRVPSRNGDLKCCAFTAATSGTPLSALRYRWRRLRASPRLWDKIACLTLARNSHVCRLLFKCRIIDFCSRCAPHDWEALPHEATAWFHQQSCDKRTWAGEKKFQESRIHVKLAEKL